MSSTEFQHYELLRKYLSTHTVNRLSTQRASAREKLTKLTKQQFSELSTDVYDELMRRQSDALLPFLQVRDDFHPKRNQARQKLATLPASRFKDLASDVYYEVERRSTNLINQYLLKYPDDGTSNAGFDPPSSPTVTSTDQSNFGSLDHLIADLGNMMGSPTKSSHSVFLIN